MPMAQCSECEYSPVAPGAKACPNCGTPNPNPSVTDRIIGRSLLISGACGVLVGGVGGFFGPGTFHGAGGAIAGAITGGLAGFIVGLIVGIVLAVAAWLSGKK